MEQMKEFNLINFLANQERTPKHKFFRTRGQPLTTLNVADMLVMTQ